MIKLLNYISFSGLDLKYSLSKYRVFAIFDSSSLCNLPSYILYNGKYYSYESACHIDDNLYVVFVETPHNSFDLLNIARDSGESLTIQVL